MRYTTPDTYTKDRNCIYKPSDIYVGKDAEREEFSRKTRGWQAIPTIERVPGGRLFCACYAGGFDEGPNNYIPIAVSDDGGENWSRDVAVIDHPDSVRLHEPVFWLSPQNELWLFFNQSYVWRDPVGGVWATKCVDYGAEIPKWSEPKRICDGVMTCKPLTTTDGKVFLPVSHWKEYVPIDYSNRHQFKNMPTVETYRLYLMDNGGSVTKYGAVDIPDAIFDESMAVQTSDNPDDISILARVTTGIVRSDSHDGGRSFGEAYGFSLPSPSARFFVKRLRSGRLLMLTHYEFTERNNMTALLSEDGGVSWPYHLLLDERKNISYPDACEDEDGRIFAIYDFERYRDKELYVASFTESEIMRGTLLSGKSYLKNMAVKAFGKKQ
ncbi:MAG: exo-alpha-sialidase [Clostridia bacterium]|nr:exo-alpha-sialidase [Clostridia bacterium]